MEKLKIFIELTRLNKPIGILLLFWPCVWGLSLAYYYSGDTAQYIRHIILFFLGSVLMRSAGCIFNDIIDKNFDKKVERTKKRPIASGKISIGCDARVSSPELQEAVSRGISKAGFDVDVIGMVPIPVANFVTWKANSSFALFPYGDYRKFD